MSLVDNISDFQTDGPSGTTVTRTTEESYDANGRPIAGTPSTFPIVSAQVPVSGRDMQIARDCQITTEVRALFTTTMLKAREPGYQPDQLAIDGDTWTVFNWQKWTDPDDGDVFYRVLVARRSLK